MGDDSMQENKKNRVIVLSREYGSGGSQIGRLLAEQLGVPYYDKTFVNKAVEDSGLSTKFLEEEEQKFINSLLFSLATGEYRYGGNKFMSNQVFIAQSNAIKEVAQQGPCVIVGRCADYILKDECDVFSVFIHADLSWRVERAVREYGLKARIAEQKVKEKDRSRARHYEYYTDRSWGEHSNYHMSINSGHFTPEQCVELIRRALAFTE